MPTYEYECKKCGVIEVEQRITEAALTKCPQCKKQPVHRLISAPAFHLKGGGWYKDLYSSSKSAEKVADVASSSGETASTNATAKIDDSTTKTPKETVAPQKSKSKKKEN